MIITRRSAIGLVLLLALCAVAGYAAYAPSYAVALPLVAGCLVLIRRVCDRFLHAGRATIQASLDAAPDVEAAGLALLAKVAKERGR